jgi:CO/xanthine dehydrogenase FAD-binding subunit
MSTLVLPEFELLLPQNVAEAVGYLSQYGKDITVMAGGTDVLCQIKGGLRPPCILSLAEIPDLDYVIFDPSKGLRIGAMATMAQVKESNAVKANYPALWQSAAQNGTPQTRNTATVVGNILRASPAGDCSCAIMAHGATVVLASPSGEREVDIDEFWLDYLVTARKPDELAVEVRVPAPKKTAHSAFSALNRTGQDLSKISAAVLLEMDGKTCSDCRIAMGAVAPTILRLRQTEPHLRGAAITEDVITQVAAAASQEIRPIDDIRSTAEYRRAVCGPLLTRAIRSALMRAA